MRGNKKINVLYDGKIVGTMAATADRKTAFEYSDEWLETGFSISPFSLPLKKQVFIPSKDYFDGLFGVFADSLPDAWGKLLLERLLKQKGEELYDYTMLDRLAIVGKSGMGALSYEPQMEMSVEQSVDDLDELEGQCRKILNTEYSEKLDELYRLGGTSGGARPKIMTQIDGSYWIIKFPAHTDRKEAGKMEYDYSVCAKKCGINMSETKLFKSSKCKGYFGIKRFDRQQKDGNTKRVHMVTAAALLEIDFEQPSLDYHILMKLTKILTGDNGEDVENMFRRMCFNVFAHNRDDHSKNFTFLYDESDGKWRLSPAYDLTFSNTYYGEHTTMVDGNGRNPGMKEIVNVGVQAGMNRDVCIGIANEIKKVVTQMLGEYLRRC